MDGSIWFLVAIFGGGALLTIYQRSKEIGKVEAEGDPIYVDVDEQEYRVRFKVKPRDPSVVGHVFKSSNDMLIAIVDARTPTGWRNVGEHESTFYQGTYGKYDQITITNDRAQRERLAHTAVDKVLNPRRW